MIGLKEWSVICNRLAEGTQILLLRKGGMQESRFDAEKKEFLLYPTHFHQREAELIPSAESELGTPPEGPVRIELLAELHESTFITDLDTALKLEGKHCLTQAAVEKRFNYRDPGIWALVLRIYRLLEPAEVEETEEMRGCKSWVELPGLDTPVERPVLSKAQFDRQAEAIRAIIS